MRARFRFMLVFFLIGPTSPQIAAAQDVRGGTQQEQEEKALWQDRHRRLSAQIREARERLEASGAELSRSRHHRTLRGGEQRLPVLQDRARAEADLIELSRALEALPEEARQAGAPPGWLREVEEDSPLVGMDRVLAESADTNERHAEVAERLRARAIRLRAEAEAHESMSLAYGSTRMRSAGDQKKRCARLARLSRELADEYDRLAEGHLAEAEQ